MKEIAPMPTDPNNKKSRRERPALDRQYGEIGIPAVVAALRYQSLATSERQADRPEEDKESRREEMAA
jgi:hypothetical protein